jgi:serine/threonine-protein kinase
MVTQRGDVKVMDFGIAAEALAGGTGLTGTGMVMGTAKYLSPEQAQGRHATPASDIYSLGAVLYELLAGRAPFEHPSPMATAMAHVNEALPPLAGVRPDVPPPLAGTVERCLAKDPRDRPRSAAALAAELRTQASAPQPDRDQARVADRDSPTAVLPAAEATDRLTVGAAGPRRPPTGRRRKVLLALLVVAALLSTVIGVVLTSGHSGEVAIPRFVGASERHAARLTHRLGLAPRFRGRHSASPKGTVIRQFPHPGARVLPGTDVILVVSSGPPGETPPAPAPSPPSPKHGKGKGKEGHGKGKGHGEGD